MGMLVFFILLFALILIVGLIVRNKSEQETEAMKQVQLITNQHVSTLLKKWDQVTYKDDYGNLVVDKWKYELDYFIDNVLCKDAMIAEFLNSSDNRVNTRNKVIGSVIDVFAECKEKRDKLNDGMPVDIDSMDPLQFEHYCANVLKSNGWEARVTQASCDQGIDVIATLGNVKAVFQCKKYSQPVGNAAVQEIVAGKQFEQADIAGVISNNTYTQSAKQLANAAGVHLLHYSELGEFTGKIGTVT